jgi:hypothetical protein
MDDHAIEVLAKFTAGLLSAVEQRAAEQPTRSPTWPEWFAAMHGFDPDNLAANGQRNKRAAKAA